jgi:hypothetical protein
LCELGCHARIVNERGARADESFGVALDEDGEGVAHPRLRKRHQVVVAALRQRAGGQSHQARRGHHNPENTAGG